MRPLASEVKQGLGPVSTCVIDYLETTCTPAWVHDGKTEDINREINTYGVSQLHYTKNCFGLEH